MHVRLIFAVTILFVANLSGYGLQPAQAAFCTVDDIMNGYQQDVSLQDILYVCDETDVRCDASRIYEMIDDGLLVALGIQVVQIADMLADKCFMPIGQTDSIFNRKIIGSDKRLLRLMNILNFRLKCNGLSAIVKFFNEN